MKKRRILCIGDSITFGAGVAFTRWRDAYPSILNRMLGREYQVLNYGISGATAQDHTDKPYDLGFRRAAAETMPELVVFMLGTNDSKPHNWNLERYEKAVKAWIDEIKKYGSNPRMLLMVPPAAFSVGGKPVVYEIRNEVIREEIRPVLIRLAQEGNIELLDLYEATEAHPEWFSDGVHPNAEGNRAIVELVFKGISST